MAVLDSPDLFGSTIFCDDIRQEADGKVTLVGSYGNVMVVHGTFPVTLPKFGFHILFGQKRAVFDAKIGIRIFMPGDADDAPSIVADMTELAAGAAAANAAQFKPPLPTPPGETSVISLTANVLVSPLVIASPGYIRVRIARQGNLVRIGTLSVSSPS